MAWSAPMTFLTATALTAAQLNTYLRDNLNATEIGKANNPGSMVVSTAANTLQEMTPKHNRLTQIGSRTSATYGDLTSTNAGVGPTVTLTTGSMALVLWSAQLYNTTSSAFARMSFEISGATTLAADDSRALIQSKANPAGGTIQTFQQFGQAHMPFGLTPGVNTFTCKYRADTGTVYAQVRLIVIPF